MHQARRGLAAENTRCRNFRRRFARIYSLDFDPHGLRCLVWLPVMPKRSPPSIMNEGIRLRPFLTSRRFGSKCARGVDAWRYALDCMGPLWRDVLFERVDGGRI